MFKEKFITLDLNKPSEKETLGYSTSPDLESIGAKNSDILSIFLIESGLLGLVGGIIGIVLGIAMIDI